MNIDPNAPAFPITAYSYKDRHDDLRHVYESNGLTIRAEIASRIMAARSKDAETVDDVLRAAKGSVFAADTLIAELNKEGA